MDVTILYKCIFSHTHTHTHPASTDIPKGTVSVGALKKSPKGVSKQQGEQE